MFRTWIQRRLTPSRHIAQVYHVDFCTVAFKLAAFAAVPARAMALTIKEKCKPGGNAQAVMTAAIADPEKLGYGELYVLFLEKSKAAVLQAIRIVEHADNLPLVFFCTHGCAATADTHASRLTFETCEGRCACVRHRAALHVRLPSQLATKHVTHTDKSVA